MPKSAYNFVPLSDKVFFPDWSDKVSMDIPFRDGISGDITIELTSHSPIFTRNSDTPEDTSFFKIMPDGNTYGIPGTSIKGVIRNVLEIATFSKIQASNARYSVRDLHNRTLYGSHMTTTIATKTYSPLVKAGWLSRIENRIVITPCEFARIERRDLTTEHPELAALQNNLSGNQRRQLFRNNNIPLTRNFYIDNNPSNHRHRNGQIFLKYSKAYLEPRANTTLHNGTIVLTGQCGRKHMEFVFYNTNNNRAITVTPEQYDDFVFIHSESGNPNEEWEYWRQKFNAGENVPVFYLQEGGLLKFGLAMMFKLAYNYTIHEAIGHTSVSHFTNKKDLAETIFGYIDETNSTNALKGRVSFSTMIATRQPEPQENITTILSSPKPTFYPYYIHQEPQNQENPNDPLPQVDKYKTLMDCDCKISGWKRYPIKNTTNQSRPNADNPAVNKTFSPLPENTVFKGKIHIHNLKKCELGAILWALDFGGREECRHSVGMAKPYGFGAASIAVNTQESNLILNANYGEEIDKNLLLQECRKEFIYEMNKFLGSWEPHYWENTFQIRNLIALAQIHDSANLIYPPLDEFSNIKSRNRREYLQPEVLNQNCQNQYEGIYQQWKNQIDQSIRPLLSAKDEFYKNYKNKQNSCYKSNDAGFDSKVYKPIVVSCIRNETANGLSTITVNEFAQDNPQNNYVVPIEYFNNNTITIRQLKDFLKDIQKFIKDKRDDKFKNIDRILGIIANE